MQKVTVEITVTGLVEWHFQVVIAEWFFRLVVGIANIIKVDFKVKGG